MTQASCRPATDRTSSTSRRERRQALIIFGILALPIAGAIWVHPWFVTQDGSIYLYNAHIVLESLKSNNPFRDYYAVRWAPLPYWSAYAFLCGLLSVFPERIADHLIVTIASLGLLASILWLRHRVAGWDGMPLVVPLAVILSINLLWLLGFYNFLLGACCYVVALGVWWSGRDRPGPKRALLLAGLLVAGFLCHPVTSVLTGIALIILAILTRVTEWRRSIVWTLVSILPSVLLIYVHRNLMGSSTESHIRWAGLTDPLSTKAWMVYVRAADITALAHTGPNIFFSHALSNWSHLPAVATWSLLGLMLLSLAAFLSTGDHSLPANGVPSIRRESSSRAKRLLAAPVRGWFVVSAIFIICSLFGPADLGEGQGAFLRQRFLLLGLSTLVPLLKTRPGLENAIARLGFAALLIGCVIQLVILWGYGRASNGLASDFMKAKPHTGRGQRVAVLTIEPDIDYEPRPLLHLPNLFGIQTGNIIWNNYAAALPYFPVRFRDSNNRDLFLIRGIPDFETAQITQDELDDWEDLAAEIEGKTDVLVVWGKSRELDEINSQWFGEEPVFEEGQIRVFRHIDKDSEAARRE